MGKKIRMKQKIQITLKDIGRDNFNRSFVVDNITIEQAGQLAVDECGKHLLSSDIYMEFLRSKSSKSLFHYNVCAGFRNVGDVELLILEDKDGRKIFNRRI